MQVSVQHTGSAIVRDHHTRCPVTIHYVSNGQRVADGSLPRRPRGAIPSRASPARSDIRRSNIRVSTVTLRCFSTATVAPYAITVPSPQHHTLALYCHRGQVLPVPTYLSTGHQTLLQYRHRSTICYRSTATIAAYAPPGPACGDIPQYRPSRSTIHHTLFQYR
eukprot:2150807-Rhodomonas_salina.2